MDSRKIEKNVSAFLDSAAEIYSKIRRNQFSDRVYCELLESGIQSPIEDIFYIACNVWCASEHVELNPPPYVGDNLIADYPCGIYVEPQVKIGPYRVDFLIYQRGIGPDSHFGPVIVELDGHNFHDKDKKQRSYEKARDRYFVKSGHRVLHYTGADIVSDPFKVAHECLCMVGLDSLMGRNEYVKENPFGIE